MRAARFAAAIAPRNMRGGILAAGFAAGATAKAGRAISSAGRRSKDGVWDPVRGRTVYYEEADYVPKQIDRLRSLQAPMEHVMRQIGVDPAEHPDAVAEIEARRRELVEHDGAPGADERWEQFNREVQGFAVSHRSPHARRP